MTLILLSLTLLLLVLVGYPLWCARQVDKATHPWPEPTAWPSLTILIVVRNGARWMEPKLRNTQALSYPGPAPQILVYSDGSDDDTASIARRFGQVEVLEAAEHQGKIRGLNALVAKATGEVLVFTDVDALLARDALVALVRPLSDPQVGGVCGQRQIPREAALAQAQGQYIDWDSRIKAGESACGSLTSNDGKLYAIRRPLFAPIPDAVTDDLYVALTVIGRGQRFVFAPDAIALVPQPVHRLSQEIPRRRRIVGASLNGLRHHKALLNPWRFGQVAIGLWINKIGRRLLPLALLGLLLGSAFAAPHSPLALTLLLAQITGYLLTALYRWLKPHALARLAERGAYFVLGNVGMLLGWLDLIAGRAAPKWDPDKGPAQNPKENDQ